MNYEALYKQNAQSVYRYAYSKLGKKEQAEDVTSETFLRLIEGKKMPQDVSHKAWLIGIARNVVYERYRQDEKTHKYVEDIEMENVKSDQHDLETMAITEDLKKMVKKLLEKVDSLTREIIILKVWEEMDYKEISSITQLEVNTIRVRYSRGIKKIQEMIQEDKKHKKLLAVPITAIIQALEAIKNSKAFQIDPTFESSLADRIHNLNVNNTPMKILNLPKPALYGMAVTAVTVLTGLGFMIALRPNDSVKPEDNVTTSSSTESEVSSSSSEVSKTSSSAQSSSTVSSAEPVPEYVTYSSEYFGMSFEMPNGFAAAEEYQGEYGGPIYNLNVSTSDGSSMLVRPYIEGTHLPFEPVDTATVRSIGRVNGVDVYRISSADNTSHTYAHKVEEEGPYQGFMDSRFQNIGSKSIYIKVELSGDNPETLAQFDNLILSMTNL